MSCATQPVPLGWRVWRGAEVPTPLTQFAIDVRDHVRKYPLGTVAKTVVYNGQTVGAFVSSHTWTYRNGVLVQGLCIPGVSLVVRQAAGTMGATMPDNIDTPDPTAAVYSAEPDRGTDWPLVIVSTGATVGVVALFLFALKHAGKAARR